MKCEKQNNNIIKYKIELFLITVKLKRRDSIFKKKKYYYELNFRFFSN